MLTGPCLPYGDGITFWPLVRIVGSLGREDDLRDLLAEAEDGDLVAERILAAVGPGAAIGSGGEMFWAVRRLFEELARDEPLIVVIEDIHWAEPKLLDLLEYLAGWTDDAPVLLLCLARPEVSDERPSWLASPNGTTLLLGPLTDDESNALLDEIGREWPLDAGARARITEAAEGNPLYVEQMAAMLAEGKSLDAIPPSIHALLAARLDRLPTEERVVLERAAVAGKDFTRRAVLQLSPDDERERVDVDALLLSLVRKDFLSARPGRRGRLSLPARADSRRRVLGNPEAAPLQPARDLRELRSPHESRPGGRARRDRRLPPRAGIHLPHRPRPAGRRRPRPCAARRRPAANRGSPRHEPRRFPAPPRTSSAERLELQQADGEGRLDIMIELSEALTGSGELSEAQTVLDEATTAAEAAGDPRMHVRAKLESAFTELHTWDGPLEAFLPLQRRGGGDLRRRR